LPSVTRGVLWSLGDSNLMRGSLISRLGVGWSIVVGVSEGGAFGSCLQLLESSAGLQAFTLRSSSVVYLTRENDANG